MHYRVRGFVYVGLSSVGGYKHEVIASLDKGHRRDDGFVEIITSGTGAATLHLDSSGIGAEYKDVTRGHLNLSFHCRSEFPFLELPEEAVDSTRDLVAVRLEREMACIEQMRLDIWQIAAIRRRTFRREDEVVVAPDDQRGRLILPEELLELRVQRHIRPVVVEEVHLDLSVPHAVQTDLVYDPGRRIQESVIGYPILVLPPCRLRVDEEVKCRSVLRPGISPVFLDRVPELA